MTLQNFYITRGHARHLLALLSQLRFLKLKKRENILQIISQRPAQLDALSLFRIKIDIISIISKNLIELTELQLECNNTLELTAENLLELVRNSEHLEKFRFTGLMNTIDDSMYTSDH